MKIYTNGPDVVSDLHQKGFSNDFQLFGNDLFWVQGNIFIRTGEFAILEYHEVTDPRDYLNELIVFGIIAPYHNIKGILLNHYKNYTNVTPPVIVKKLNECGMRVKQKIKDNVM